MPSSNDLLSLLEYIEHERSISRDELIDALEKALVSAARKTFPNGKNLFVNINKHTGKITGKIEFEVTNGLTEGEFMNINEAKLIDPKVKVGDSVFKEIPQSEFGRIAAQTAKQTMMQQLRKAEKNRVFQDFKDSLNKIVSGTVRRFDGGNIIVDFQKAEGILAYKDKIPGDDFEQGDRINALLVEINTAGSGPSLILSRTSRSFLKRLFEREVAEIAEGTVEIKSVARDPGSRSKVAVVSHNPKVDPVGACIGLRGSRVKNIMAELNGEKIDIVRYDENMTQYIINAMQPSVPKRIELDTDNDVANIYVEKDQVKLAIGRNWQNAKLCGQLLGLRINIVPIEEELSDKENEFKKKIQETIDTLVKELQIETGIAELLVNNGFLTIDGIKAATKEELLAIGLNEVTIEKIFNTIENK